MNMKTTTIISRLLQVGYVQLYFDQCAFSFLLFQGIRSGRGCSRFINLYCVFSESRCSDYGTDQK